MNRRIQKILTSLLLGLLDIGVFALCTLLAVAIMEPESFQFSKMTPFFINSTVVILIFYSTAQMYSFKNHIFWTELRAISKLTLYCLVMMLFFKLWFPGSLRIRTFFFAYTLFACGEMFLRYFFRRIPRVAKILTSNVILLGAGPRANRMMYRVQASKFSLYKIIYALSEPEQDSEQEASAAEHDLNQLVTGVDQPVEICTQEMRKNQTESNLRGVPIIGTLDNLTEVLQKYPCDELIVALKSYNATQVNSIVATAVHYVKRVQYVPDASYLINYSSSIREMNGVMVLSTEFLQPGIFSRLLKRCIDFVAGLLGVMVLIPLAIGVGVAMLFLDRGPVFFAQERVGLYGKRFKILKFRTMVKDAEAKLQTILATNPELNAEYQKHHKLEKDPRITMVGRFLRKTSLDELPQAFNLIWGNMSLVGPRPYLAREIPRMKEHYDIIIKVKPGLTGLWQVSGRSDLTFEDRLVLDEYYIHNHSWWNDCIIILKTLRVVFFRLGAL